MATIVTVHGTFAHSVGTADALNIADGTEPQWWQPGSAFEKQTRELVAGADGKLDIVPFVWSSANSEIARREAGTRLLGLLREIDDRGEPFCVVGHSHGGSVITSALVESAAKKQPLERLGRWITIGTPFVALRKERFLFTRLNLSRKVLLVASMMLLMMFAFYAIGDLWSGEVPKWRSDRRYIGFLFSAAMMSIPFIVFYTALKIADSRELYAYGRGAIRRAQEMFAPRWLAFCHEDDEAVQGLKYLPKVQLHLFDKEFAVGTITMAAIVALPLVYLFMVTSPPIMVGIANFLRDSVYDVNEVKGAEAPVTAAREDLRRIYRQLRETQDQQGSGFDPMAAESARRKSDDLRAELREKRRAIEATQPNFAKVERALRFKRRFLERDGKPCEGNTLCGGGHDYALNSKLLFHVVTDELSAAVVNDDLGLGAVGGVLRLAVPIVLVPAVFGALALAILAIIQVVAVRVSALVSKVLNRLTLNEIRRSAYGNDTEGEIALAADYSPTWIQPPYCSLPAEIGDKISECSNTATSQSLAKFRNAISNLAFAEAEDKTSLITNYLTWKELIHTSYFEVPEFQKLVLSAISRADGFRATDKFKADPDYAKTALWLTELERRTEQAVAAGQATPAAEPAPFPA